MPKNTFFKEHQITLKDDYEGKVIATLIEQKSIVKTSMAILYINGFADYFFQKELADWANQSGFNFYALDLRKHGRSILPHQLPNHFRNHREFYEEIDYSVDLIRNKDQNNFLLMIGHSTGGLIASLCANDNREKGNIDAIILNSPFFDFQIPPLLKSLLPFISFLGGYFPEFKTPAKLDEGYPKSIHKDYFGEWDFDKNIKPIEGFNITLGWIRGIYLGQKELKQGLKIKCPVLVMHSSKSVKPGKFKPEMKSADSVLNINDIHERAKLLGQFVSIVEIENGMHDLILSRKEVRDKVYKTMGEFISTIKSIKNPD